MIQHFLPKIIFIAISLLFFSNPIFGQIQQINDELKRLTKAPDSISKINSLNRLGHLYRNRNADSLFHYGLEARRLATKYQYKEGQIQADQAISFGLFKRGLYAESLELLGQLLTHYQHVKDTVNIIQTYMDIGNVRNKGISERKELIGLAKKAIQLGKNRTNDSIMGPAYVNYALRNTTLSDDSLHYYLDHAYAIAEKNKDETTKIYSQILKAYNMIVNDQMEDAFPLIQESMEFAQYSGNALLEINSLFLLFNYYQDDPRKALKYMYQAFDVANNSGDQSLKIYILNNVLNMAQELDDKDEIIRAYAALEKSMTEEWERSRQFINDYVQYQALQDTNLLLIKKNARRTTWLIIISFSAIIVILLIYLIMLHQNRKAKMQIESLNEMANMQVIEVEEAKYQAIKEEQIRMSQDLHDGLSSSIAAISHQFEILAMDINDPSLKNRLDMLQQSISEVYHSSRNKSHEWYLNATQQEELSFEKQVKVLTDSAFPENRYNKKIHIDDYALSDVSAAHRITLLRIIQEAITNIIKHAKAKTIEILIYREEEIIILSISDDGKGFIGKTTLNKPTMGIQSMTRRVQYLGGTLNIRSGNHGTDITISIPV